MNPHLRLGALLLFALVAPAASAADWPSVPLPEGVTAETVSRDMLFNGLPMRSSRFESDSSIDEVIEFYREQWGAQLVETKLGHKRILGRLLGDHYVTVDLARGGAHTIGIIGVMETVATPPEKAPGYWVPKPSGTRVISDIQYMDVSGEPRTLTMQNQLSPAQNYLFYRKKLLGDRWHHEGQGCSIMASKCLVRFSKGEGRLTMTLNESSESTIIIINRSDD